MATEFEGRKIDHEVCDKIVDVCETILSPYTFNNRKNKGAHAAIEQLIDHIITVTENYTKPARIIKIDFKSYFPNALWSYANKCINEAISLLDVNDAEKEYLKWLANVAIFSNPAKHCELRTPKYMWDIHIDKQKSIFYKPYGVGGAIGRLIWQTAMGLYINDIIKWLTEDCGIKLVCFVDDIVMIVPEERHKYALSLLPILRNKLMQRNVFFNEGKFYDQPCVRGLEFLGSRIKPYRAHLNNRTYDRAIKRIQQINKTQYKNIDTLVSVFNSYSGLLKNRTDYKRLIKLKRIIYSGCWKWLDFDSRRLCLIYKPEFSVNARLNLKYNLKIKKYNTK